MKEKKMMMMEGWRREKTAIFTFFTPLQIENKDEEGLNVIILYTYTYIYSYKIYTGRAVWIWFTF